MANRNLFSLIRFLKPTIWVTAIPRIFYLCVQFLPALLSVKAVNESFIARRWIGMAYYTSFIILPVVVAMRNEEIRQIIGNCTDTWFMRCCGALEKYWARREVDVAIPAHTDTMADQKRSGPIGQSQQKREQVASSSQSPETKIYLEESVKTSSVMNQTVVDVHPDSSVSSEQKVAFDDECYEPGE